MLDLIEPSPSWHSVEKTAIAEKIQDVSSALLRCRAILRHIVITKDNSNVNFQVASENGFKKETVDFLGCRKKKLVLARNVF